MLKRIVNHRAHQWVGVNHLSTEHIRQKSDPRTEFRVSCLELPTQLLQKHLGTGPKRPICEEFTKHHSGLGQVEPYPIVNADLNLGPSRPASVRVPQWQHL